MVQFSVAIIVITVSKRQLLLYQKEETPNFTKTTIRRNLVFFFTTLACSSMRHSIGAVHFWKLRSLLTAAAAHMIIIPSFKNQGNRHLPSI
jgi:hypothetical protein